VKAFFGCNEFIFAPGGVLSGQFECGFVGFGTAVAEKAFSAEGAFGEEFGQLPLGQCVKGVVHVNQLGGLLLDGFYDAGMAMADAADGPAGK